MKIDNVELNVLMKTLYKILKLYNDCMILSVKKLIRNNLKKNCQLKITTIFINIDVI